MPRRCLGSNAVLIRYYYRGPDAEHSVRNEDEYLIRDFKLQEQMFRKYQSIWPR